MSELYFENNSPSSDEFRHAMARAIVITNPVDDLLELSARLRAYEQKHHMSSIDFYQRYQAGTLDGELQHCIGWAAICDLFLKSRRVLEATLIRSAMLPELDELVA
jgi:hypothetical protein